MQAAVTNEGIVRSIVKAPVVSDGTTAGRITDFVINLEVPLQPNLPGLTLLEGNQIRVTLPEEIVFDNEADFPIKGAGEENCAPGNLQCSTAVLLQGWPQNPIRPPFQNYSLSYDADTNTLVFTALQDLIPDPPLEPGIKQIHLILNGFTNPAEPGSYPIEVTAEVGPEGAEEQGVGILEVLAESRPSINVTSAFNGEASYRPNTIYQMANPGELSAFPYDFLLWGEDGEPLEGVTIEALNARHSQLVQGEEVIGHIYIDGPAQAEGHQIAATAGSTIINSPVTGFETGRLNVCFKAGTVPGDYVVTLKLNGGNTVRLFVEAVDSEEVQPADPDACQAALSSTEQDLMGAAEETVTGQVAPAAVEEPQQPTSIADLAGVWSRPKPGYPKPGKYLWQLNPDGIGQVSQEETVAGKVVKIDPYYPNQWSAEGTEWQVVTTVPGETDIWGCSENARYEIQPAEGGGIQFVLINDECVPRREIMIGGVWQREAGGE
jgi:hypothetical protein